MAHLNFRLIIFFILLLAGCTPHPDHPRAVNGTLDLSGLDLKSTSILLNGEWNFAPAQFHLPGREAPPTEPIQVPGLWANQYPDISWGTYTLTLSGLPKDLGMAALLIPDILCVGEVWVNNKKVASGGITGRSGEEEKPDRHTLIPVFETEGSTLTLVIQVSNFHNAAGGINVPIRFGTAEAIHRLAAHQWIITGVQGAAFIAMGLFHLIFFKIPGRDRAHLYFGLFCLAWGLQVVFGLTGGLLGDFLFPWLPWQASIDITLFAYALTPPLMIMLYHSIFSPPKSRGINRLFQIPAALFLIYLILTPANAFDPAALAYFWVTLAALAYLFCRLAVDLWQRRPGTRLLVPGYLLLLFSIANDMLTDLHLIQSPDLINYGIFGFIAS